MPQHILIVCHPDHGHVIPNLAVVAELVERGHRVTYLTAPSTADIAAGTGATVRTYDSRYRDADFHRVAVDPSYLLGLLLDESEAMVEAAHASLDTDRPDAVVYDTSVLFAGRILARRWDVPSVQVIPMFASNEHFSYLKAIYDPGDNGGGDASEDGGGDASGAGGAPPEMPEWIGEVLGRIGALAGRWGVSEPPQQLWWEVPDCSLVTITRAFQYAGDTFDDRFAFVGPCIGDRAFLGEWAPPSTDLPVVLVSLGQVFNQHPDFFRTCVDAFTGQPWRAVMTVADGFDPAELGQLPANVEVHRWVPHLSVLAHASLVVTHGGMGTVMEALSTATPLLVVPTAAIDRPTGARVRELGLGVTVAPEEITAERLVADISRLLGDAAVTEAARRSREEVVEAGGAARAADVVERHIATVKP